MTSGDTRAAPAVAAMASAAAMVAPELRLIGLPEFPSVGAGDDLAALTMTALSRAGLALADNDVLIYAQKVVSKAEGRQIALSAITPGLQALELARIVQKDARLVELVLRETRRVVRAAKDVLIVEDRRGFIMANAGIDQSNVAGNDPSGAEQALLLPEDPDASAARLAARLGELARTATGAAGGVSTTSPAVIISDSFGRPWRLGTVGVAIGCAGLAPLLDLRGQRDLFGRTLRVSVVGHADELAAAASLVMGQAAEGRPVVLVRGLIRLHGDATRTASGPNRHAGAAALIRPAQEDLFR